MPDPKTLTAAELAVVDLAGDVAVQFSKLSELHPSDVGDIVFHVHAIQNIVLCRAAFPREARTP